MMVVHKGKGEWKDGRRDAMKTSTFNISTPSVWCPLV